MRALSQSASIWQLLAIAYLVITVPSVIFVKFTCNALDYRIAQAQVSKSDGDKFAMDTTPRSAWIIGIGRSIRSINAPFSVSPKYNPTISTNRIVALSLSDIRTALLYIWTSIFLIGGLAIWRLGILLNRPLAKLMSSIERLTQNQLQTSAALRGPRNIEEMSQGLEKLRKRLLESEKQQTLVLRHISHEIKTPLTSIKEGSKLLSDELLGPINEDQREVSHILVKSSSELQIAIENLLNYNAAISQDTSRLRDDTDLSKLIEKALGKHRLLIKQKVLELKTDIEPCRAHVDGEQILAVFENLISNAIKHSPEKATIKITLRALADRATEFIIHDDGPGIHPDQRHKIFDAFFVGNQRVNTTLKGTGLGLSIAKQYIDAHDGTIELLDSAKGASFRVVLN